MTETRAAHANATKASVKSLFGRPVRVVLAVWIMDRSGQSFYLAEAQLDLNVRGFVPSATAAELRTFVAYDMLSEVPDGQRVYFTQRDSPFWAAFRAIADAVGISAESP